MCGSSICTRYVFLLLNFDLMKNSHKIGNSVLAVIKFSLINNTFFWDMDKLCTITQSLISLQMKRRQHVFPKVYRYKHH